MKPTARDRSRGLFVTFEGIEGSGKTTQVERLVRWLRSEGWPVRVVREPGGTRLGEALRSILLRQTAEPIDPRAELFLYQASRAQLVSHVIVPALQAGEIVVADRFADASVAYQGGGRHLGPRQVRSIVRFATCGIVPDRTYLLDLSPNAGLPRVRARGRPDRLEKESLAFHSRVRGTYRAIAAAEPDRVRLVRGTDPVERIAERIRRDLVPLLSTLHRSMIR